ncbi:MAG: Uma2 family endonuclease [Candidatus Rokuibacteriota bacterium]
MEQRSGGAGVAVGAEPTRRRFTRQEYHRMGEVGILKPTDRVELIRGEIVCLSPIGRRHSAFVSNLTELLVLRLTGRGIVWVQSPVVLADDSEPQPDLVVLRRRPVPYKDADATAADAALLIEVAESSLRYDRSTKLALYAEAGIAEYWIVDCPAEAVEVYRSPGPRGYGDVTRVSGGGRVSPLAFPDVFIALSEIFA